MFGTYHSKSIISPHIIFNESIFPFLITSPSLSLNTKSISHVPNASMYIPITIDSLPIISHRSLVPNFHSILHHLLLHLHKVYFQCNIHHLELLIIIFSILALVTHYHLLCSLIPLHSTLMRLFHLLSHLAH